MKPTYRNLLAMLNDQPLAVLSTRFQALLELGRANPDLELDPEALAAVRANPQAPGSVAVIPLIGFMQKREDIFTRYGFATSTDAFVMRVAQAVNDPTIKAIVFDIDSPGGMADGMEEAGTAIRGMRGGKPMVAVANTMMCSAAYGVGSGADEVAGSPSATVGSIGVWTMHVDESGLDEQMGIKVSLISAGKYKVAGNPFEPLSEEARGRIQDMVNQHYSSFVNLVAKNRGVAASAVRSGYGEGGVLLSPAAQEAGLIDRVATLDETVRRFAGGAAKSGARSEEDGPETVAVNGSAQRLREKARLELAR